MCTQLCSVNRPTSNMSKKESIIWHVMEQVLIFSQILKENMRKNLCMPWRHVEVQHEPK